jgi:hypothetical protein
MSELQQQSLSAEEQQLEDLKAALNDVHSYYKAILSGSFPAPQSKAIAALLEHFSSTYKQLQKQYNDHPLVQEQLNNQKEVQEQAKS